MNHRFQPLAILSLCLAFLLGCGPARAGEGIAMHGELALKAGEALPYADPDAPKGGRMTFGVLGTFDNLNPMAPRGTSAPGLRDANFGNLVYESLLERNYDEPFSLYGFLASDVWMPPERDSVTFTLDPRAHFSDGTPVTSADVAFTLDLLKDKGQPYMRAHYAKVESVETPDSSTVTFRFPSANDRELPLILGLMPILARHATDPDAFGRTALEAPVGSGPYTVAEVDPGRQLVLRRDPAYWGSAHPLNAGRYNAEDVRFRFFRDGTTMFEAFKTGEIDLYLEGNASRWASAYDFPAVADGRVERASVPLGVPRGMYAFVFNTRRAPFDDIRVRRAINLLFDFPWLNENLFHGELTRTTSYFSASELASTGRPASAGERELLAPFEAAVAPDVMAGAWTPPTSNGSGRDRAKVREALGLFGEAGWHIDGSRLVDTAGRPFAFEILVATREDERLALAFQRLLQPAGIEASVRYVDSTQYNARLVTFDFDMIRFWWPASLSPGNEQLNRWSPRAADIEGSFNFAGAKNPAIDATIQAMLAARDRAGFQDAVRALDRVLLSGVYVVPLYHTPAQWIASWSRLDRPPTQSLVGIELETWWVKP